MTFELDIAGYDIDGRMINISKVNAKAAGVLHDIHFKQLAVKDFKTDKENGVIVANPPYGQRLSDRDSVHVLYEQMGKIYRPMTTWSKYILTSDLNFEKYYGEQQLKDVNYTMVRCERTSFNIGERRNVN